MTVYACGDATTLILQPANPGITYGGSVYDGMRPEEVTAMLIQVYQALGFTVYRTHQYFDPEDDGEADGPPVVAMGRQLP